MPKLLEFKTYDNLVLPGLLYEAEGSKRIAIYLHGNGSASVFYNQKDNSFLENALISKGISLFKFNNRGAHIIKKLDIYSKKIKKDRKPYGCAHEVIKDCVIDIDSAIKFLKSVGYEEFYLIGKSTGANKICVYNHLKSKNEISKYVLVCGGDDTGIYYNLLGDKVFWSYLKKAKKMVTSGYGDRIFIDLLKRCGEIFSYQSFVDIANPDGDYNCFPFSEILRKAKISKKPLFRYFKEINKKSLVVYGEKDEYGWDSIPELVEYMTKIRPNFDYQIIKDADHGFNGKLKELSNCIANWLSK